MIKWGLEEEVFVTEPKMPTTESLYYLAKLLWNNPEVNYFGTASNFARGRDVFQGLMSCVEVSTSVCDSIDELLEDLKHRRKALSSVCDGFIVPMGHLINFDAPTNTAALQIHLSGFDDREKAYNNLVHFLPVLALISANAPAVNENYFGKSFRMAKSYAIGPLTGNPFDRFQDIIIAKRLNTLEIRIFDPFWDLERLEVLLKAVSAIISSKFNFKLDVTKYNRLRKRFVINGIDEDIEKLHSELSQICELPKRFIQDTPGDEVWELYSRSKDLVGTYSALNNAYRNGELKVASGFKKKTSPVRLFRKIGGFGGYYLPKLPFIIYKYLKES